MRRIAAVFLPQLRIELVRSGMTDAKAPLALVIATNGGTIKDERSLLGNTRLDEVSAEARAFGIHAKQTIAAARARCSALRVRVITLDAVQSALGRIAEALLAFGATTSFDLLASTVWVDVTGCSHLHRSPLDPDGERTLAERIAESIGTLNHAARVAIADGPVVAAAVAQHGTAAPIGLVPHGENAAALAPLPLHALPLSEDALHWLSRLGIQTVGDLQRVPRPSLCIRLGAAAPQIMALLAGEDRTPLVPYLPPEAPEEIATLEYGIESTDALLFVMKVLCDRMAACLAGRTLAITKLEVILGLDRAIARNEPRAVLHLSLGAPLAKATELLSLLRARIHSYTIEAPILLVTLRAVETISRDSKQLHFFVSESKAERIVPRLAAEIEATLGPGTVGTLQLTNRWLPEERSRLVPVSTSRATAFFSIPVPDSPAATLLSGAPEPTRWLRTPMACVNPAQVRSITRLETNEWWTVGLTQRDYATAWIETVPSVAWVEIDHVLNRRSIRGWID